MTAEQVRLQVWGQIERQIDVQVCRGFIQQVEQQVLEQTWLQVGQLKNQIQTSSKV